MSFTKYKKEDSHNLLITDLRYVQKYLKIQGEIRCFERRPFVDECYIAGYSSSFSLYFSGSCIPINESLLCGNT